MAYNITYNNKGETKVIRNGEISEELNPEWKRNMIDQSVFNNISREPKILTRQRVVGEVEEEAPEQEISYNVEVELNGSNFITSEDQRILLNPIVTDSINGDLVDEDDYGLSWYLNDQFLSSENIFELDTTSLEDKKNNIVKLEVVIGNKVYIDEISILKYLGFGFTESDGGDGSSGTSPSGGGVIQSDERLSIIPRGDGFRVGEEILFTATAYEGLKYVRYDFGDGSGETDGLKVSHRYSNAGIYDVRAVYVIRAFDWEVYTARAKIEIVE